MVEHVDPFLCGVQLIKRMEELKEEKEKLAVDIMREEEFLTNTLQRKLAQVRWPCEKQSGELVDSSFSAVTRFRRKNKTWKTNWKLNKNSL